MIIVNRLYTVLSMVLIILVTIFYLVYLSKYENREYILYMQSNTAYTLQQSLQYKQMDVFNENTSSYNINIGKVYLDSYQGYTKTGRFILLFSLTGDIDFKVIDDKGAHIGNYNAQNITAYYPIHVDFHVSNNTKFIQLQYSTTSQSISLYKMSIEFY